MKNSTALPFGFNQSDWEGLFKKNIRPRFVAYIDILGFKQNIWRNNLEKIYTDLLVITETKREIDERKDDQEELFLSTGMEMDKFSYDFLDEFIFSDSIFYFTKDDRPISAFQLLRLLKIVSKNLLLKGIPFTGAIAKGNCIVDIENNIFAGQPIVDVFELANLLKMYGIIRHHSCELTPFLDKYFEKYECNFKNGKGINSLMVSINHLEKMEEIVEKFRKICSGPYREYLDNTITFYNSIDK